MRKEVISFLCMAAILVSGIAGGMQPVNAATHQHKYTEIVTRQALCDVNGKITGSYTYN